MSALAKLGLSSRSSDSQKSAKTRDKPSESQGDLLRSIDTMLEKGGHGDSGSLPSMATSGYLHKKSGAAGEERSSSKLSMVKSVRGGHWDKRFFLLPPDGIQLSYYKNEEALLAGEPALGSVTVADATMYLKSISKKGAHRFTVRTAEREFKLRADSEADYKQWLHVLRPRVAVFRELVEGDEEGDEDDDDEDETPARGRSVSTAGGGRARQATAAVGTTSIKEGWLLKKSGGHKKSGGSLSSRARALTLSSGSWDKRYFALPLGSTELSYYNSQHEFLASRPALGGVDVAGASLFLKEIKSGTFRFTVKSETRELKLKAESEAEYAAWMAALEGAGGISGGQGGGGDSDDDGAVPLS